MSYRIYKSERPQTKMINTTVATGIATFEEADTQRNQMQAAEDKAHPERTSWTKVLYIVEREKDMNSLSNGSLAVGSPGSWMRFQAAYEDELYKAIEKNPAEYSTPLDRTEIAKLARKMLTAAASGRANVSQVMKKAAKAAGAVPTIKGIAEYLKAAGVPEN